MNQPLKIGIAGLGTVGAGVVKLLAEHGRLLSLRGGRPLKLVAVSARSKTKKRDIPKGMWVKCKDCGEMIFAKELAANLKVCPKCDLHFSMTAAERVADHRMVVGDQKRARNGRRFGHVLRHSS